MLGIVLTFLTWVSVLDHRVFVLDQWVFVLDHRVFVLDQWVFVLDHRVFVLDQWVFVLDHRVFVLDQWVFVLDQWVFALDHRVFVLDQWVFVLDHRVLGLRFRNTPAFLVVLNREYLHSVYFQLGTCFLPSIHLYHSAAILESLGNKGFVFALSLPVQPHIE